MPERLVLGSGPKLTYWLAPERSIDVTEVAHRYLFEGLRVESRTTLGDLILLLRTSPILAEIFARWSALGRLAEIKFAAAADPGRRKAETSATLKVSFSDRDSSPFSPDLEIRLVEQGSDGPPQVTDIEGAALDAIASCPIEFHPPPGGQFKLTLGALLDSVLRDMSFFGPPSAIKTLADEIAAQTFTDEVDVEAFLRKSRIN